MRQQGRASIRAMGASCCAAAARHLFALTLLATVAFWQIPAAAQVITTRGEFLYGPEVSERQACEAAETRAKEEALRQVYGEMFSSSEQDACRETSRRVDSRECFYNRFAWSSIDGDIRSVTQINKAVTKVPGASKCTVELQVDVVRPEKTADVNFDFEVKMNQIVLRPGDAMTFSIEPASPLYLAVFGWTPDDSGKGRVVRLFPNDFDREPMIKAKAQIPSAQNANQYDFKVEWAEGVRRDFIDEYLFFVATKKSINWLGEYSFDSFRTKLREIAPPDKRVVKRSYRIVNQSRK